MTHPQIVVIILCVARLNARFELSSVEIRCFGIKINGKIFIRDLCNGSWRSGILEEKLLINVTLERHSFDVDHVQEIFILLAESEQSTDLINHCLK